MKRVVIDARKLRSSTGRYVRSLLLEFHSMENFPYELILVIEKEDSAWCEEHLSSFRRVISKHPHYSFREQIGLARLLYSLKADLVHFWMPQQPLLFVHPRKITTVHDLNLVRIKNYDMPVFIFEIKQLVFKLMLQIITRTSKRLITPSEFTRQDLTHYTRINSGKVTLTYESADFITDNPEALPQLINKPFLLYYGQSSPYKGQRRLITAHQKLLAEFPDLHLAIAGKPDNFTKDNMHWVIEKDYKNVDFLGFVSDGGLRWLLENAQAYVCPSTNEGFGLCNVEAFVHGCPVVSSNATCLPEIGRQACEYFDPLNNEDMVAAIGRVLRDQSRRSELIVQGHKRAKDFSWRRMAEQTLATYAAVLK